MISSPSWFTALISTASAFAIIGIFTWASCPELHPEKKIALLQYLDLSAAHRWHLQQTIREAAILQIHEVILIR